MGRRVYHSGASYFQIVFLFIWNKPYLFQQTLTQCLCLDFLIVANTAHVRSSRRHNRQLCRHVLHWSLTYTIGSHFSKNCFQVYFQIKMDLCMVNECNIQPFLIGTNFFKSHFLCQRGCGACPDTLTYIGVSSVNYFVCMDGGLKLHKHLLNTVLQSRNSVSNLLRTKAGVTFALNVYLGTGLGC